MTDAVRRVLGLAWKALKLEITLYRALGRWLVRRPEVPAGTVPIGYSGLVAPMLWLWTFGSAVEVVVLDVVLTGPTTRETPNGPSTVTRVGLWVDEPREVADVLRRRRSAPLR